MARKADTQIFWIVVLAAVFWAGIWEHDKVASFAQRAYTIGHGMIHRASSR